MANKLMSRADFLARVLALAGVGVAVVGLGSPAPGVKTETDPAAIKRSAANQTVQPYASQFDLVSTTGNLAVSDIGQFTNPNNGVLENQIDFDINLPVDQVNLPRATANGVGTIGVATSLNPSDHAHPLRLDTKIKTINYTMTSSDCVIRATGGAGGITITLPAASSGLIGMVAIVMKTDAGVGTVTVAPNGTNTILGGSITLAAQGSETMLRCATATSWEKISSL